MRLLQFTDTHLTGTAGDLMRGVDPGATLDRCLAHARQRHPAPDAWLLTGDLVQDDAGGYRALRERFDPSPVPVHYLPGNHDLHPEMHAALAAPPYVRSLATRYGPWLLLMLDSTVPNSADGHVSEAELGRLEQALSAHADAHVLACLHHAPIAHGSRWLDRMIVGNAEVLFERLRLHGGVRGVLWGHVHQALDEVEGSFRLMATPSTCVQFLPESDDFALDARPPAYRWLVLGDDGSIDSGVEWVKS